MCTCKKCNDSKNMTDSKNRLELFRQEAGTCSCPEIEAQKIQYVTNPKSQMKNENKQQSITDQDSKADQLH